MSGQDDGLLLLKWVNRILSENQKATVVSLSEFAETEKFEGLFCALTKTGSPIKAAAEKRGNSFPQRIDYATTLLDGFSKHCEKFNRKLWNAPDIAKGNEKVIKELVGHLNQVFADQQEKIGQNKKITGGSSGQGNAVVGRVQRIECVVAAQKEEAEEAKRRRDERQKRIIKQREEMKKRQSRSVAKHHDEFVLATVSFSKTQDAPTNHIARFLGKPTTLLVPKKISLLGKSEITLPFLNQKPDSEIVPELLVTNLDGTPCADLRPLVTATKIDSQKLSVTFTINALEEKLIELHNYGEKLLQFGVNGVEVEGSPMKIEVEPPERLQLSTSYSIFNATDNSAMNHSEVSMTLKLINQHTDTDTDTVTYHPNKTSAVVQFDHMISDGVYRLITEMEGFVADVREVVVVGGNMSKTPVKVFLSPNLSRGDQIRFVLTWGSQPDDLDAHLVVYNKSEPSKKEHINWFNRTTTDGSCKLDCDVRNGSGPETITISVKPNMVYHFFVENFSSRLKSDNPASLAESHGIVKIYFGESQNSEFTVPNKEMPNGFWWDVCKIEGKVVEHRGTISDQDLFPDFDFSIKVIDHLWSKELYQEALPEISKALAIRETDGLYCKRGHCYNTAGNYPLALADLNKAIEMSRNPHNYFSRGVLFSSMRMKQEAIADFEAGLSLDPNATDIHIGFGWLYQQYQEWEKAIEKYSASLLLAPSQQIYRLRAMCYRGQGKIAEATQDEGEVGRISGPSADFKACIIAH